MVEARPRVVDLQEEGAAQRLLWLWALLAGFNGGGKVR
jgi:hypothetical protein